MNQRDIGALIVGIMLGILSTYLIFIAASQFAHVGMFIIVSLLFPLIVSLVAGKRITGSGLRFLRIFRCGGSAVSRFHASWIARRSSFVSGYAPMEFENRKDRKPDPSSFAFRRKLPSILQNSQYYYNYNPF